MELLKQTPDNYYGLCIVDPPYGINVNMNAGRKKDAAAPKRKSAKWDRSTPDREYFDELMRVSLKQIIWGGNYFSLPQTGAWVFWDKCVAEGCTFSDGELAWRSFGRTLHKCTIPWSGFIGSDGERIHPTQKPVALYQWILKRYAKPGDKILDTHGGSMSIAIACDIEGYDLDLCELDKDYFEAGKKRLEQHQAQPRLFDEPKPKTEQLSIGTA